MEIRDILVHKRKRGRSDYRDGVLFLAGEGVPPGIYEEIGTGRVVRLEREDCLPVSLDGRVACYALISPPMGKEYGIGRRGRNAARRSAAMAVLPAQWPRQARSRRREWPERNGLGSTQDGGAKDIMTREARPKPTASPSPREVTATPA